MIVLFTVETKPLVKAYTFWLNKKYRRLFQVVDIPLHIGDTVTLLELKDYHPDEERVFSKVPYSDWVTMTEEKKQLIPHNPKI